MSCGVGFGVTMCWDVQVSVVVCCGGVAIVFGSTAYAYV